MHFSPFLFPLISFLGLRTPPLQVYPITYALPGDDHGSYENFYESSVELMNNPNLFRCVHVGYTCGSNLGEATRAENYSSKETQKHKS
jgi:hypothetical protein